MPGVFPVFVTTIVYVTVPPGVVDVGFAVFTTVNVESTYTHTSVGV